MQIQDDFAKKMEFINKSTKKRRDLTPGNIKQKVGEMNPMNQGEFAGRGQFTRRGGGKRGKNKR